MTELVRSRYRYRRSFARQEQQRCVCFAATGRLASCCAGCCAWLPAFLCSMLLELGGNLFAL